jgi:hypothetical protein
MVFQWAAKWIQLVGLLEKLVLNEQFGIAAITFGYNNPP